MWTPTRCWDCLSSGRLLRYADGFERSGTVLRITGAMTDTEFIIEELRHHTQQISDMQREFREMRVGLSSLGIRGKKIKFAERQLARQVVPLVIALSMEPRAEQQMRELGINYRVRAVMS